MRYFLSIFLYLVSNSLSAQTQGICDEWKGMITGSLIHFRVSGHRIIVYHYDKGKYTKADTASVVKILYDSAKAKGRFFVKKNTSSRDTNMFSFYLKDNGEGQIEFTAYSLEHSKLHVHVYGSKQLAEFEKLKDPRTIPANEAGDYLFGTQDNTHEKRLRHGYNPLGEAVLYAGQRANSGDPDDSAFFASTEEAAENIAEMLAAKRTEEKLWGTAKISRRTIIEKERIEGKIRPEISGIGTFDVNAIFDANAGTYNIRTGDTILVTTYWVSEVPDKKLVSDKYGTAGGIVHFFGNFSGSVCAIDDKNQVKIRLSDFQPEKYRQGLKCYADMVSQVRNGVLAIPIKAIVSTDSGKRVAIAGPKGKITFVEVETGASDEIYTEITGGLKEGDEVIFPTPWNFEIELSDLQ